MAEFWAALPAATKFFYYLAVPATAVLLLQTILSLFGLGGHGGDVEVADSSGDVFDGGHDFGGHDFGGHDVGSHDFGGHDVGGHDVGGHGAEAGHEAGIHDSGFRMFTLRGIVAFFAVFGWTGAALSGAQAHLFLTLAASLAAGFAAMALIGLLFYGITKLQSDGTLRLPNAVGLVGRTYIRVPPARSGTGKVQITVQDSLRELPAVSDDPDGIPAGVEVRVVGLVGRDTLLVARTPARTGGSQKENQNQMKEEAVSWRN